MFKLQISSIFNFDRAHQSWISGVLGVNTNLGHSYFSIVLLISKQNTSLVVNLKFLLQNKQTARLKGLKWDLFGYIVMRLSFLFCLTSQHLGIQNRKSSEELKVHLEVYNAKAYFMIWENITYSHYCSRVWNRRRGGNKHRSWKVWQKKWTQALE